MDCPVCGERLRGINRNGVCMDICPLCKGVWLDKRELEKLLEVAASGGLETERVSGDQKGSSSERPYVRRDDHDEHNSRESEHHDDYERGRSGIENDRKSKHGSWLSDVLRGLGGGD